MGYSDLGCFGGEIDCSPAFPVSRCVLPGVLAYIRRQDAHHRKMAFQEELIALLERHATDYDERHLWA